MTYSRPPLDPTSDPDLAHLFDLLSMLPGPTEDPEFWAAVGAHGRQVEPNDQNLDYIYEKMGWITLTLREPGRERIAQLCTYLLKFFRHEATPDLWKVLNKAARLHFMMDDETGKWWVDDLTQTAWRLFVRYRTPGNAAWADKWEFTTTGKEWLPSRRERGKQRPESY